jgi:hypothetical protein
MEQRMSRRLMLRLAGRLAVGLGVAGAFGIQSKPAKAETCHWKKVYGPVCNGGQYIEQWCYRCCAGTSCWTEWCQWQVVGSC